MIMLAFGKVEKYQLLPPLPSLQNYCMLHSYNYLLLIFRSGPFINFVYIYLTFQAAIHSTFYIRLIIFLINVPLFLIPLSRETLSQAFSRLNGQN